MRIAHRCGVRTTSHSTTGDLGTISDFAPATIRFLSGPLPIPIVPPRSFLSRRHLLPHTLPYIILYCHATVASTPEVRGAVIIFVCACCQSDDIWTPGSRHLPEPPLLCAPRMPLASFNPTLPCGQYVYGITLCTPLKGSCVLSAHTIIFHAPTSEGGLMREPSLEMSPADVPCPAADEWIRGTSVIVSRVRTMPHR